MTTRDPDEILNLYGPGALRAQGEVISRPDGVAMLAAVVDAIGAIHEDEATATRAKPLIDLYRDTGRFRALVVDSIDRSGEIEGLLIRLGSLLSARMADQCRTQLREGRKNEREKAIRLVGDSEDLEVRAAVDWPEYPAGINVPEDWRLSPGALRKVTQTSKGVSVEEVGLPLLVTRKLKDADDETWSVELAWNVGHRWHTSIVPRSVALDSRALVRLADDGLPVSSATSRRLVEWLTALDQHPELPQDWSAARCGWVGQKAIYYLLGERCIYAGERAEHRVSFSTASPGARQFARAVKTRGTWDGWLRAPAIVKAQPAPWVAIYAACAAPMLRLLGAPSFGIDLTGQSGSGKSTVLELASSAVGDPRKGQIIAGWDGTLAGTESGVATRCDMVLCLDEGQLVPDSRQAEAGALLFAIVSGAGRAKGGLGRMGLQHVDSWRTVLLSTSEQGITSWNPHDGVRRRIIELRAVGVATASDSTGIREVIADHYGHLYPRLLQALVEMTAEEREELRASYRARRDQLQSEMKSSVGRSLADYMAVMETAAEVLHSDAVGLPRPECSVSDWLWQEIRAAGGEDDRARRAAELALSWAWAHRKDFAGQTSTQPHHGWAGIWVGDDRIGIIPERMSEVLIRAGMGSPESIYREWRKRGWIEAADGRTRLREPEPDRDGVMGRRNRIGVIMLRRDAIQAGEKE
jgi:putative DNA primase/helicase